MPRTSTTATQGPDGHPGIQQGRPLNKKYQPTCLLPTVITGIANEARDPQTVGFEAEGSWKEWGMDENER